MEPDKCPSCGGSDLRRDEVHNGVCMLYGPFGCADCGWSEDSRYDCQDGPIENEWGTINQYGNLFPRCEEICEPLK